MLLFPVKMKINKLIISSLLFFTCLMYSNQEVDIDSPEGWGMAFMTSAGLNLGQSPPSSGDDIGTFSISAELSSIPHLTREQQKIGFGGFKDEDLNKSPVFGKLRANIVLPLDFNAEISWTPPFKIDDSKPDDIWGAAISKSLVNNDRFGLGLRLFMLRGGAIASVTCSKDVIKYEPYTPKNTSGCIDKSKDKLQMDHEGAELFISFNAPSNVHPWISLASINIDTSVEIDALLKTGRENLIVRSDGSLKTYSIGINYDFDENRALSFASSYTPLDVERPRNTSGNDNFWNLRVGIIIKF